MVKASYNHPCVIIWGFLNEAATDEDYVRPLFEKTVASLREMDSSRLISYASRCAETDLHFDLVDLIAINIYPGWYGCDEAELPLDLIAPHLIRCLESIDERGFADKPVIVSEIGAEALYGWHDVNDDFFTEDYQAEYLRRACAAALGNPRCSGIALWHFSDFRASEKGRSLQRPRAFNNKGTFDEYRRPKAAYKVVRAAFLEHRTAKTEEKTDSAADRSHQPVVSKLSNGVHS
jgi:beta-glucuronidase